MNWHDVFLKNYPAKLALLFMAVFLWFFVVTSREYDQVLSIPIRTTELRENKVFLEDPPRTAQVRFRGKGTSLLILGLFGDPHMSLDLSTIQWHYDFPIYEDQVRWASGINVKIIEILNPDTVKIRLDDEASRKVKVQQMLTVTPAQEYMQIGNVKIDPDSVTIRGPKSVAETLNFVSTQVNNVVNATGPINMKLDLVTPENAKIVLDPPAVRVYITIEKIITRQITEIPVNIINCSTDKPSICDPPMVNITVRGARSEVANLNRDNIMISVNALQNQNSTDVQTPAVHLPAGVELLEIQPDTVRIIY